MLTRKSSDAGEAIASIPLLALTAAIVVVICVCASALFAAVWHRGPFEDLSSQPQGWLGALMLFASGAAFHELLHAFGWKTAAGVAWSDLSLGRSRRKLGLIVKLTVPVRASAYRIGMILPAIVLGIAPILGGLTRDSGLLVLWGSLFLFESFSDLAILLAIRRVPSKLGLLEHPA